MTMLDDLLATVEGFARKEYQRNPKTELAMIIHGRAQSGPDVVISPRFRNDFEKYWAMALVRQKFRESHVIAYAMLTEGWTSKKVADAVQKEQGEDAHSWPAALDRPSQQPDRQEVLMLQATDGVNTKAKLFYIKRDPQGRVRDLELVFEQTPEELGKETRGLMTSLLEDR